MALKLDKVTDSDTVAVPLTPVQDPDTGKDAVGSQGDKRLAVCQTGGTGPMVLARETGKAGARKWTRTAVLSDWRDAVACKLIAF